MFWSKDAIKGLGYESVEEFVKVFVREHNNCCVRYTYDGIYLDYDFDSESGIPNFGYISRKFTEEELEKIIEGSKNESE